jgi:hypothetical protein
MTVGFTGSRSGLSYQQQIAIVYILMLLEKNVIKFRHGDCVGSDEQFHKILVQVGWKDQIEIHPCTIKNKRAYCKAPIIHDPKPPLDRNRDIVDNSDLLIVCPKEKEEQLRSGTWATYRYAKQVSKRIIIITPDGKYQKL